MYRLMVFSLALLISCTAPNKIISYTVNTIPEYKIDPPPQKIQLLNTCNIVAKKYRDNKEQLFISLTNDLMDAMAERIGRFARIPVQVLHGYTATANYKDSSVFALIKENKSTHAILINAYNVLFSQTKVDVVRNSSGNKERTAHYDIVSEIEYSFYSDRGLVKEMPISKSRHHSSRGVISGLLAAGPDIVANRKDALAITMDNGYELLRHFFPGEALRYRPLFTGKGFENVNLAIAKPDYEAALIESLRLINDPDKKRASKANYNCAVLFERKNQPGEAKIYLEKSIMLFNLPEARRMLNDFVQ